MNRYGVKLLFQFRVSNNQGDNKIRICEERVVNVLSKDARDAIGLAKRMGRKSQHSYVNADGAVVRFEFVGVMDMIRFGPECAREEVWYEIVRRMRPKERRSHILPQERLLVSRCNGGGKLKKETLHRKNGIRPRTAPLKTS